VKGDAVKVIVKILKSENDGVLLSAVVTLAEHGATHDPCTIIMLTDCTQRTSRLP